MTTIESLRLSPTAIGEYLSCGHRYYIDRVLALPKNPKTRSLALIEGFSMHKGIEWIFRDRAAQGAGMWEECRDFVVDHHSGELAKGWRVDDVVSGPAGEAATSRARTLALVRCVWDARENFGPIAAEDVEREFNYTVAAGADGLPITFRWRLDLYSRAAGVLYEFKSSTRSPSDGDRMSLQSALYAWSIMDAGLPLVRVQRETIVADKAGKKPARISEESWGPPAPDEMARYFGRIDTIARAIAKGVFVPAVQDGPSAWVCSPTYCQRWTECRFGTGNK